MLEAPASSRRTAPSASVTGQFAGLESDESIAGEPGERWKSPWTGSAKRGLAWIDRECQNRFDKRFLECSTQERTAVLDDIAWPAKAKPEFARGVAFFNSFRDLTAAGFFSSKMGVGDLQYMGNVMVAEWKGCPDEALKKLGVTRLTNS